MLPTIPMVDTHCHLNLNQFEADRAAVIQRATAAHVTRIIIPAIDLATIAEVLALAASDAGIYAAIGVHPNSTRDFMSAWLDELRSLAQRTRVIAVGEIGLDYHWDMSPRAAQIPAFEAQLALASELGLPVIIHNREANADTIAILETWAATVPDVLKGRAGVLHSFSGTLEMAERALAAGFYLGFTGPITFKKAEETRLIARHVPLNRLLVETDAPYLTPHPYRGQRNEPAYIPYMVEKLAEVHSITSDEMAQLTTDNACRLFQLS